MNGPADARERGRGNIFADLGPRLSSAVVLLFFTVVAIWLNGIWFAVFIGLVFAGFYREWEIMITGRSLGRAGIALTGIVALMPLAAFMAGPGATALILLAGGVAALTTPLRLVGKRLVGLTFIGAVILALIAIRGTDINGLVACVYLGATIWMTDTGAFFAGRQFGGAKLNPEISPAKTWSGAVGGLIAGALSGLIVWAVADVWLTAAYGPWWIGLLIALTTSVAGQLGDLSESGVKRCFRVKDSGDIIPGHGGIMDRLDSLTFGALLLFVIGALHSGTGDVARGILIW